MIIRRLLALCFVLGFSVGGMANNAVSQSKIDTAGNHSDSVADDFVSNTMDVQIASAKRAQGAQVSKTSQNIGEEDRLARTFANIVTSCVGSKFNVLALGGKQLDLKLKVHFYLNVDGSLVGTPEVSATGGDNRQQAVGIYQAYAALANCSPFPLPADKYDIWKEVELIIDPFKGLRKL